MGKSIGWKKNWCCWEAEIRDIGRRRSWTCCLTRLQLLLSPQGTLHIFNVLEPTYSSCIYSLCSLVSNKAQKYTLPGAQQDMMIGWEICRKHKRSSQILQLAVHFSWEIKIPAEKERDGADAASPWGFFSQPLSCPRLVLSHPLECHGSSSY